MGCVNFVIIHVQCGEQIDWFLRIIDFYANLIYYYLTVILQLFSTTVMDQLSDYSDGYELAGRERANTWPSSSLAPHKSDVYSSDPYNYNYNPADYCSPQNLQGKL